MRRPSIESELLSLDVRRRAAMKLFEVPSFLWWLLLYFLLFPTIILGMEEVSISETTSLLSSSTTSHPQSAHWPSHSVDSHKQDKTDIAQVKSYLSNSYYQPPPAAIPVPLPIKIQTGSLMMPPGMKPPTSAYQQQQPPQPPPMYPQPLMQPPLYGPNIPPVAIAAAPKGDHGQPVQMEAAASNQYANFIREAHLDFGSQIANSAPSLVLGDGKLSNDLLSNHKPAPPLPKVEILQSEGTAANSVMGTANLNGLPSDQWPQPAPEMPKIANLDVSCEKDLMRVSIEFDRPFNGVIFSKGHFRSPNCIHLPPGLGRQSATFDVPVSGCGMQGNSLSGIYGRDAQGGGGSYFENTIVIQYDPQVQEVWDQARRLRCSWHDHYEKSVTFRPFPVDMLEVVRADFAGDNVGCWMQIQVGRGPWKSEVSGIVKIGQTMTMVLAVKDDESKFDILVRNCVAYDGKRQPIQLVDNQGCVVRPKLMSRFTKIKNFGSNASVLSYAHFQAFKFPDSMEVYFQCTIQICRFQCPEQCSGEAAEKSNFGSDAANFGIPPSAPSYGTMIAGRPRDERDVSNEDIPTSTDSSGNTEIGIRKMIQVVSTGDLAFSLANSSSSTTVVYPSSLRQESELVCMSTPGFAAILVVLLAILVIACLVSTFLCLRYRTSISKDHINDFFSPRALIRKSNYH